VNGTARGGNSRSSQKGARPTSRPITRACEFIDRSVQFSTLAGLLIQCRAALLNTASNSLSQSGASPFVIRTSRPSFPVASNRAALASTPMTWRPIEASFAVSAPSPHAMSKIRSPARREQRNPKACQVRRRSGRCELGVQDQCLRMWHLKVVFHCSTSLSV
jgi:hypothetical protein